MVSGCPRGLAEMRWGLAAEVRHTESRAAPQVYILPATDCLSHCYCSEMSVTAGFQ